MGIAMPSASVLEATGTESIRRDALAATATGKWSLSVHKRHHQRGGLPEAMEAGLAEAVRRHNHKHRNRIVDLRSTSTTLHTVKSGVTINGRKWQKGSECEFVKGSSAAHIGIVRTFFITVDDDGGQVLFTLATAYPSASVDDFHVHTIDMKTDFSTIILHEELRALVKICPHHTRPDLRKAITIGPVHNPK